MDIPSDIKEVFVKGKCYGIVRGDTLHLDPPSMAVNQRGQTYFVRAIHFKPVPGSQEHQVIGLSYDYDVYPGRVYRQTQDGTIVQIAIVGKVNPSVAGFLRNKWRRIRGLVPIPEYSNSVVRDFATYNYENPFVNVDLRNYRANSDAKLRTDCRYRNWRANKDFLASKFLTMKDWQDKYKGIPLYIVGNGPSLRDTAPILKGIEKGHVMALNGAARYIAAYRQPDWFLSCDWLGKKEWLEGWDLSQTDNLAYAGSPPKICRASWRTVQAFTIADSDPSSIRIWHEIPKDGICFSGAFAGIFTALHIAFLGGFDPIILVGVDMASRGIENHPGDPLDMSVMGQTVRTKNIFGSEVQTTSYWIPTLQMLRCAIFLMCCAGRMVINASGAGIVRDDGIGLFIPEDHNTNLAGVIDLMNSGEPLAVAPVALTRV